MPKLNSATRITVPVAGVCPSCKEVVPRGVKAIWINGRGLFHEGCAGDEVDRTPNTRKPKDNPTD